MADSTGGDAHDPSRRDFLYVAAAGLGVVGTAGFVWPLVDQMNPSQDVLALSSIEVDISSIEVGQSITVSWRGKPVFVDRRTPAAIAEAVNTPLSDLRDPETDAQRTDRPEWLVIVGVCTHLGCVPLGQKASEPRGEWGGWFCPCHGSHYDTAGRIRKGPAPLNLPVPEHAFLTDTKIKIG